MTKNRQNWSGHHTFKAESLNSPQTVAQLQELVQRSSKVKVLGAGHSFNDIADTTETHISLEKLKLPMMVDRENGTVTVNAGVTYGRLCRELNREGYAIHNMASLPHVSVIGACATATHGSGDGNGNLATAVAALEMVTADGELVVLSRAQHGDQFQGAVVGLGGLGVVTKVTLDTVPAFSMQQEVYEELPEAQLDAHFDDIMSSAYSVSLFTDWQDARVNQLWLKRLLKDDAALPVAPGFFQATAATQHLHPLAELSAEGCTPQLGIPGPWHERLPHFRMDHTPASGDELQTEYFVPRHHAVTALQAVARLQKQMAPHLWLSEIRSVAADRLWLSPSYRQATVGIHFSWKKNWPAVQNLCRLIEEQLAPFQARPHWGKLFTMSPSQLQSLYPKLAEFRELLRLYDPQGKFGNAFLDTYIFGEE